jgi:hypothetical protein
MSGTISGSKSVTTGPVKTAKSPIQKLQELLHLDSIFEELEFVGIKVTSSTTSCRETL